MRILDRRTRRRIAVFLTASLLGTCLSIQPVLAEGPASSRDVTFKVREGDLLIAVNPVAWEDTGEVDKDGKTIWNKREESLGTIELATLTQIQTEELPREAHPGSICADSHGSVCGSLEMRERERKWYASHPDSERPQAARLAAGGEEYAVGDWIWHGYNNKQGTIRAEDDMYGAPVYYGDQKITTEVQPGEQLDGAKQVYRQYKCLAIGGEKGSGYTIWGYVAGSETNRRPGGEVRGKDKTGDLPTYLSMNRAEKIVQELEEMDFMEKLTKAAGDYSLTDSYGDKDGRIAFFFEPIETATLGFSWFTDQQEKSDYFDPAYSLDCLHIQLQCTIGDKNEKDPDGAIIYNDNSGEPPYATMAHELTHYIVSGYCEQAQIMDDGWLNEWFAQSVMMQVIQWDGSSQADKSIWDDVNGINESIRQYGKIRVFAGPTDPAESLTYPISTLKAGYFTGRMGEDIWRDAIRGAYITEERLSEFLEKRKGSLGKGLEWWRSAFCISILGNADGSEITLKEDREFELNPYGDDATEGTCGGTHKAVSKEVLSQLSQAVKEQDNKIPEGEKPIIHNLYELTEEMLLEGGGSAVVFRVDNDIAPTVNTMDLTIRNVGEDIVWAHKNSRGEIETEGMPEPGNEDEPERQEQRNAIRNEDGSWDYSDAQEAALSLMERRKSDLYLPKSGARITFSLFARDAVSFNKNKRKLTEAVLDQDLSEVSVNGMEIPIRKVVLKNPKKAYVGQDSVFKETISENNMSAYSLFKPKKRPGYYLVLDTRGLSGDWKKVVSEANKELKKNPFPLEILPVNFIKNKVMAEFDSDKGKMKKLVVSYEGAVSNLKYSSYGKKDYIYSFSGDRVSITGTNNFNGTIIYDPKKMTMEF